MNFALPPGMIEATRLTREGRLAEATALLQRLLRGEEGPDPAPAHPRQGPIIDMDPEPPPQGGRFLARSFSGAAGRRDYKLYVPGGQRDGALPLVVMLHGCTQSPDDFAAGTRMNALAEAEGFLVAYPAQSGSANAQRCWNWFSPDDQRRDQGEPSLIAGITREIMRAHAVDPRRV
jgi:hypothetical protein